MYRYIIFYRTYYSDGRKDGHGFDQIKDNKPIGGSLDLNGFAELIKNNLVKKGNLVSTVVITGYNLVSGEGGNKPTVRELRELLFNIEDQEMTIKELRDLLFASEDQDNVLNTDLLVEIASH